MKLYLLRHGETSWNKEDRMAYNKNLVLNDTGIKQAQDISKEIEKINYDFIFSSPFIRAIQTAEIVNVKKFPIIIDDRLAERNAGILDGVKCSEINFDEFFNYNLNVEYEGAENIKDFCKRVWSFLDDVKIKYKDKTILVVSHTIVIRAIKAYLLGIPGNGSIREYRQKNCELSMFDI